MIPQLSIEAFSELMGIALLQGVALTIFIQQSLRPVFEYRHFAPKIDGKGIKWPATLLVCVFICLLSATNRNVVA